MRESTSSSSSNALYNKGDWARHCEKSKFKNSSGAKSDSTCEMLNSIFENDDLFVDNFVRFCKDQAALIYAEQQFVVYFAVPHDTYGLILKLKSRLESLDNKIKLITGADSFNFLEKKAENCHEFNDLIYDVHSLFEQEICFQSTQFLWSTGSSWSMNVLQERSLQGRGGMDSKNLKTIFNQRKH